MSEHDHCVADARAIAATIDVRSVAYAFAASLTTRELGHRSALGSFAVARALPAHAFVAARKITRCPLCGVAGRSEDVSCLNFERLRWGGVRHLDAFYAAIDLKQFARMPVVEPTTEAIETLARVLEVAAAQPTRATPGDLAKALTKIVPGTMHERRTLIQLLGYAGVLQPSKHRSFYGDFPPYDERAAPTDKYDWAYPVVWWRGEDGLREDVVRHYFPFVG